MTPDDLKLVGSPVFQYGFAGMSVVLLGIIVWLIKMLMELSKDVTKALHENSAALSQVTEINRDLRQIMIDIKDNMLQRPCLAESLSKVKFKVES